ncbi:hypothetical protein [Sphingobacterium bovistauri]|uniref:DUF1735 domain-containing protein n=1 Tax=Sphingobacterium bovistauri TaxID=2781959 RepID=A0ABS7Z6P8_9SPHI|nr:hypothetical protein [Sphingobacterium bovistauri]MCA5005703.1 hypothetical protein [Sphingobacterium bovistauri]
MKTKLNSTVFALLACATLSFSSCKNDTEYVSLLANPSAAGFNEIRRDALADLANSKSFKAENGITFQTDKGTKVKILPNCLRDNMNNMVTGDVTLSFVEMYDRGNMTATNKPLMGRNNALNLLPLVTGGQFNLEVTKGNQKLYSGCPFFVDIPASLSGGIDEDMTLWSGDIDEDGELAWNEVKADSIGQGKDAGININTEAATYHVWASEFGWTNVDRFYVDSRPKTQIKVTVPEQYNMSNSAVYLSYEGERNVLARLDTYDSLEKFFSEHYGYVPVGLNLHVIFTSESNGSLVYAIKKVTIAQNQIVSFNASELSITSKSDLVTIINNLN